MLQLVFHGYKHQTMDEYKKVPISLIAIPYVTMRNNCTKLR